MVIGSTAELEWNDAPKLSIDQISAQLDQYGYLIFEAEPGDDQGQTLLNIAERIGVPEEHNKEGIILWDVKPMDSEQTLARSHTLSEFPLHTDAAFEAPPPRFVGLQVIRADRFGGGETLLLDVRALLNNISKSAYQTLQSQPVTWIVPEEFRTSHHEIQAPIIGSSGAIRYRRDIIVEKCLSDAQKSAIQELDQVIDNRGVCKTLFLRDASVIILDNWRMVHGRTEILDNQRHLKRVRFSARSAEQF